MCDVNPTGIKRTSKTQGKNFVRYRQGSCTNCIDSSCGSSINALRTAGKRIFGTTPKGVVLKRGK